MIAFLWTMFVLHILGVLLGMSEMGSSHYPRQRKPVTLGLDVVAMMTRLSFLGWISYLLFAR